MRNLFLLAVSFSISASAQTTDLKCAMVSAKDGSQFESWIAIDPAANMLRAAGEVSELQMTNEAYSSISRSVGGFSTARRIDRRTGSISVTTIYAGQVFPFANGLCEKESPPASKF